MNTSKIFLLGTCLVAAITSQGAPRTNAQIRAAAISVLSQSQGPAKAPADRVLRTFAANADYSILGYDGGGFAIIAADDLLPEVLGYSDKAYDAGTKNPNFRWWLDMVAQASRQARQANRAIANVTPDTTRFAPAVPALLRSEWGQMDPYWNLCPITTDTCVVGCVATAMAQIMYYHRYPLHGKGSHTMWVDGKSYTADFGNATYDWDNMLDFYETVPYTQQQADAVALLSYHCGISVDMQYSPDGSGAYSYAVPDAFSNYFGYDEATYIGRQSYSEKEWMEIIYEQLNNGWPVYYSGADPDPVDGGGHAFVLDGYDQKGNVSVNWGWYGCENGYYNIALLDPFTYSFNMGQAAVINIIGDGPHGDLESIDVALEAPGTLTTLLADRQPDAIGALKVSGPINSTDVKFIRQLCGNTPDGYLTRGNLEVLDLRDANIVAGGEAYITDNGKNLYTARDQLTERIFYNCRTLRQLYLPQGIKAIGKGALAICNRLDTLYIPSGDDKDYVIDGGAVYGRADSTLLICVLPTATGTLDVRKGTTVISDYAIAGCPRLHQVILPGSLTSIGHYAFYQSGSLMQIRCYSRQPVSTGASVFKGIRSSVCELYVPAGSGDAYKHHSEWSFFDTYNKIYEFGVAITARNAGREYGEPNPAFAYTVSGDRPNGKPVLTCDATEESPVGDYVIHIEPGTITDEIVEFYDGILKVWQATLRVSVGEYTRYVGEENPGFDLVYDGFKLGECPDVLDVLPVAVTTATADSPVGDYPITVSGGEALNYSFRYTKGVLHVVDNPDGISDVTTSSDATGPALTLDGRRVADSSDDLRHLPKGIYIINGKKLVLR